MLKSRENLKSYENELIRKQMPQHYLYVISYSPNTMDDCEFEPKGVEYQAILKLGLDRIAQDNIWFIIEFGDVIFIFSSCLGNKIKN